MDESRRKATRREFGDGLGRPERKKGKMSTYYTLQQQDGCRSGPGHRVRRSPGRRKAGGVTIDNVAEAIEKSELGDGLGGPNG
jgi:hypothetical protein